MKTEIFDAIKQRRSCRSFLPGQLPDDAIARIIECGSWAPNAGNAQPWYFYILRDNYLKKKLAEAALQQNFIAEAPLVIVVCADLERARAAYKKRGEELYCLQDTAAAAQNMLLAAHAMGLGSCWVGAFDERITSDLLDLLPSHRPVALLCFGKPAQPTRNPGRLPLHKIYSEVD